jgi:hypothetical protein
MLHVSAESDQVRMAGSRQGEPLGARLGRLGREALLAQAARQDVGQRFVVVDHQDRLPVVGGGELGRWLFQRFGEHRGEDSDVRGRERRRMSRSGNQPARRR